MEAALMEVTQASVTYTKAPAPSLYPTDLTISHREAVGVVGESGSGKTTLARVVVGSCLPTTGTVSVGGTSWSAVGRRSPVRRSVQMIFQDPFGSLNPSMTARKTVAEVLRFWDRLSRQEASDAAGDLLLEVGLGPEALDQRPDRLSGGQCQRVGIARALACRPQLLVADEPTSALDASVQAQILNLLERERADRNLALLLVSHDLQVVHHSTDHVLVMYGGRVVEEGPTAEVLTDPRHPYTRSLVEAHLGGADADAPADGRAYTGCVYASRCPRAKPDCEAEQPPLMAVGEGRRHACLHPTGGTS